jgi:SAM-dependent methyltransferase
LPTESSLSPPSRVRADFDRIARLSAGDFDHNAHYHDALLNALPARVGRALDLGCGTGAFSRRLAARAAHVLGIDLAPEMLRVARERSAGIPNLDFEECDFAEWDAPQERFDAIASIATLHHLPLTPTLAKLRDALRPGGLLLVLDLVRDATLRDRATSAVAVPTNLALHLAKSGTLRVPAEFRAAWIAHGRTDHYLSLGEVRAACEDAELAGARVQRHLLWRYSLIWEKPG